VTVDRVDSPAQQRAELLAGLLQVPARMSPKFFYDEQGSALYGAITRLDEYDLPRTEAAIFERHRADIAAALPPLAQWVDLGCGDGRKSWPWIETLALSRYIGVDIAEGWLRASLQEAAHRFPRVAFDGVVTDFTRGLHLHEMLAQRPGLPSVFFYPGSSIGNFEPGQALVLLRAIGEHLNADGRLLIAVDGLKPVARMTAAYDDALGVTAAFNRNILRVANREIGTDFDPAGFDHRAVFDARHSRIEMHLVARSAQRVHAMNHERRFERGEFILTEYSYKHSRAAFEALLAEAGFAEVRHWSDPHEGYHVFVAGH
jgi:dimethylhistidine N-methyltransferase